MAILPTTLWYLETIAFLDLLTYTFLVHPMPYLHLLSYKARIKQKKCTTRGQLITTSKVLNEA